MTKQRINVEDVRSLVKKYRTMMALDPNEVELFENGVKVEVPQQYIDEWKFTGLGFCFFIEFNVYKNGLQEE